MTNTSLLIHHWFSFTVNCNDVLVAGEEDTWSSRYTICPCPAKTTIFLRCCKYCCQIYSSGFSALYNVSFAKSALDKPYTIKLLEPYRNSIPLYRHALFISNMSFEASHEPLKAALTRQIHIKLHISAVHNILCRDWTRRS